MTEEKKDELNEQQEFLNEQEKQPESTPEEQVAPEAEETVEVDEAPEPETSAPEPVEESEPAPIMEAPVEKPQPQTSVGKTKAPQKHSPMHEEVLKKQALEQQEVKEVLVFFRKYAKPAVIAVVAVCVFVLADKFLKAQRHKKEATADTALMEARNAEDLQAIVDDYASTPTGPLALMELARDKFNAGQFDEAEELYTRFTKKHSGHELAAQAELNLITCKEAKSQFGEAHLLYGEFAKKHADSFLAPSAKLGQARCLEALNELNEAQIAYEDIIVNYPETSWSRIAEANLKTVLGKKQ